MTGGDTDHYTNEEKVQHKYANMHIGSDVIFKKPLNTKMQALITLANETVLFKYICFTLSFLCGNIAVNRPHPPRPQSQKGQGHVWTASVALKTCDGKVFMGSLES